MIKQLNFLDPIGPQIAESTGNRKLVPYGINEELSDYRAHVGFATRTVYVFETEEMKELIRKGNFTEAFAFIEGIKTASGKLVSPSSIRKLQSIVIPPRTFEKWKCFPQDHQLKKAECAVQIVVWMIGEGMIALKAKGVIVHSKSLQIDGCDIIINNQVHMQAKCDYRAGPASSDGSGYLFIQTEECNPFKFY